MIKVSNMVSPKTGKEVANQFYIITDEGIYFQSYNSTIVYMASKKVESDYCDDIKIMLDEYYWNYSKTTSKYRNVFLGESTKETQSKIDSGEYLLVNLN